MKKQPKTKHVPVHLAKEIEAMRTILELLVEKSGGSAAAINRIGYACRKADSILLRIRAAEAKIEKDARPFASYARLAKVARAAGCVVEDVGDAIEVFAPAGQVFEDDLHSMLSLYEDKEDRLCAYADAVANIEGASFVPCPEGKECCGGDEKPEKG